MTEETIKTIEQLKAEGVIGDYGPQKEESVSQLERVLSAKIPSPYRKFLLRYGALNYNDNAVSGIFSDDPLRQQRQNVYFDSQEVWSEYGLPSNYLVINYDDTLNGMWCYPLNEGDDPPVYDFEINDRSLHVIFPNFETFLLHFLRE